MKCPYCNNPIPVGVNNCPNCGAPVQQQSCNGGQQPVEAYPKWMPLTSMILGIVSFLCLLGLDESDLEDEETCLGGFIIASLSLIFGIIALAKKYPQKALSITGIVLAGLTLLMLI